MSQASTQSSSVASAPRWDEFLRECPRGQFQQSSKWAAVKAQDGWQCHRRLAAGSEPAAGGVQLLWKSSRLGRIGYVSKGPVLASESPEWVDRIFGLLLADLCQLRLRAMILQPPDASTIDQDNLVNRGFNRETVQTVIRSTAIIDLAGGREAVFARMNRQVRREMRIAVRDGVKIASGDRDELRSFFHLMVESSRRQGSSPNPNRVELLESLWDNFFPAVGLDLANVNGRSAAGLLTIAHGRRLTFWKKGWNAEVSRSFANCLLNGEVIGRACDRGFAEVDFVAMNPSVAACLTAGGALNDKQRASKDVFNLRFGATPRMLPPAQLLIISPVLRRLFRLSTSLPHISRWLNARMASG